MNFGLLNSFYNFRITPNYFLAIALEWIVYWFCMICVVIYIRPGGRRPSPKPFFHFYGQASRPISTGQLNALLHLHTQPINVVVYNGPLGVITPRDT